MRRALALLTLLCVTPALAQTPAQQAKRLGLTPFTRLDNAAEAQLDPKLQARLDDMMDDGGLTCAFPDHADPELAFASLEAIGAGLALEDEADCHATRECHRALMRLAAWKARADATGTGSYPASCHPDYPGVHAIYMFIDVRNFNATSKRPPTDAEFQSLIDAKVWGPVGDGFFSDRPFTMAEMKKQWGGKPMWQLLRDFTIEYCRRIGVIVIPIEVHGDENIHVLSRFISGGVIGVGWYPGSTCNSHVEFHIDNSYTASLQGQLGLWLHECSHCLQGPHTFSGQDVHQGVLSYRYNRHLVVGASTGDPIFNLPRDPSFALWTRLYGGKPVGKTWRGMFATVVKPPPTGKWKPPVVGDQVVQTRNGVSVTYVITAVGTDEGSTLAEQVTAAVAAIPDYKDKDTHRGTLASLYEGLAQGVADNKLSVEDAHTGAQVMRGWLVGPALEEHWSDVLKLIDGVTSADGFASVARGLGGSAGLKFTPEETAAMVLRAQGQAAGLPPQILAIIKLILPLLPPQIQPIVAIILAILDALPAEEQEVKVNPTTASKRARGGGSSISALSKGGDDETDLLTGFVCVAAVVGLGFWRATNGCSKGLFESAA